MSRTIAIVEDEAAIRENYADALRQQGFAVDLFANRQEAEEAFDRQLPDLALLDIGLEHEVDGGFELCRHLRAMSTTLPIIFLTARDSDLDTISGLRLGADDYLTKDISLPNLCARIQAFFRRIDNVPGDSAEANIHRGRLRLDMDRFAVYWQDEKVDLTLTEFWIVNSLARRPGHVKNRDQLMQDARIVVDDATITSHVKRVRAKFQEVDKDFTAIDTVYGMGYRWVEDN